MSNKTSQGHFKYFSPLEYKSPTHNSHKRKNDVEKTDEILCSIKQYRKGYRNTDKERRHLRCHPHPRGVPTV